MTRDVGIDPNPTSSSSALCRQFHRNLLDPLRVDPGMTQPGLLQYPNDKFFRRLARIGQATIEIGDHGFLESWIHLEYDEGASGQGFGQVLRPLPPHFMRHMERHPVDDKSVDTGTWIRGVLSVAGVDRWSDLQGKVLWALYDTNDWNAPIVGIESLFFGSPKTRQRLLTSDLVTPASEATPASSNPASPGRAFPASAHAARHKVRIDLATLYSECQRIIREHQPGDGSPPMVALSADVLSAVTFYAQGLSDGIFKATSKDATPNEVQQWRTFAEAGPGVSGPGAADAWGSTVQPIHISNIDGHGGADLSRSSSYREPNATHASGSKATLEMNKASTLPTRRQTGIEPLDRVLGVLPTRRRTGIEPLDRVLGGGLVAGGLILISGLAGVGKSTLLSQMAGSIQELDGTPCGPVLWISGEETQDHIKLRADRIGITSPQSMTSAFDFDSFSVDELIRNARQVKAKVIIIDSGNPSKLTAESVARLGQFAKDARITIVIATRQAPLTIEYIVDASFVLEIEGDLRDIILRAQKNRFGSIHQIGRFKMTSAGMIPQP